MEDEMLTGAQPDENTTAAVPRYRLGLRNVEIDAVLDACDLVGRVLKAAPDNNARAVARLLVEAAREQHRTAPLTRSILVQVARALQRRDSGSDVACTTSQGVNKGGSDGQPSERRSAG